jgi:3-oxoacyl-[acyl-carrier protein] reductase
VNDVAGQWGRLDILVNNAGLLSAAKPATEVSWAEWDATLGLNLSAPWYLACHAREPMGPGGVIVNNASTASYYPSRDLAAYNVSKAALVILTRVLALEWARDGIRVVAVAPGKIDTDLVQLIPRCSEKRQPPTQPQAHRRRQRGRRPGGVPRLRPGPVTHRRDRAYRRRRATHGRLCARS